MGRPTKPKDQVVQDRVEKLYVNVHDVLSQIEKEVINVLKIYEEGQDSVSAASKLHKALEEQEQKHQKELLDLRRKHETEVFILNKEMQHLVDCHKEEISFLRGNNENLHYQIDELKQKQEKFDLFTHDLLLKVVSEKSEKKEQLVKILNDEPQESF